MKIISLMLFVIAYFTQTAEAAWPDASEGRIYAVDLFRRDFQTPGNILEGNERTDSYQKACDLKYYPACNYKEWTNSKGLSDLQDAGKYLGQRCKSEALSCVVSGWAKGFVDGVPSSKAPNPSRAIEDLTWGCKKKAYAPACSHLGEMYMMGVGSKSDYKTAQTLFNEACKAKDEYGCYIEGDLYYNGWGVSKDYTVAKQKYDKGCALGYTQACVKLGTMYELGKGVSRDYEKANKFYGDACAKKNGDGCFNSARMFATGLGGKGSAPIAFAMYSTLCSAGDVRGCYGMATLYQRGLGINLDLDTATNLYEKACGAQYAKACSALGKLLLHNPDIKDPVEGVKFVKEGCDLGDAEGCVELGVVYYDGIPGEVGAAVDKNIGRAKEIFIDTCDKKLGLGCYKLGVMYDAGEGFNADPKKALELYRKGCDYLDGASCGMIGHRYLKGGGGVMKSSTEAVRHFELGCEHGDNRSCREMADFYYEGTLVEKNLGTALAMYKQSCDLSSAKACFRGGKIILDGELGQPNFYDALKMLEKGCKLGLKEACDASEPIMFQARYEGIIEEAFNSHMCEVWTLNQNDPAKNQKVVLANKDIFTVLEGEYQFQEFTASHKNTNYKEEGVVKVAQSYWDLVSDKKKITVEHHENWVFERVTVQEFPGDESFSRDPKGSESVYFSRENQTLRRNTSKRCRYVNDVKILTTEACSEVQALIASRLVTKCR